MSFLQLQDYHAFVTGAAGGIGQAIVAELLGISSIQNFPRFHLTTPRTQHKAAESPRTTCDPFPNPNPPPCSLSEATSHLSPQSRPASPKPAPISAPSTSSPPTLASQTKPSTGRSGSCQPRSGTASTPSIPAAPSSPSSTSCAAPPRRKPPRVGRSYRIWPSW